MGGGDTSDAAVYMMDQSLLPQQVICLRLTHEQQVAEAIKALRVRGLPLSASPLLLGPLSCQRLLSERGDACKCRIAGAPARVSDVLAATRPTAVNLFWAIERMRRCANEALDAHDPLSVLTQRLRDEAQAIADEDFAACWQMGVYGAELIADGDSILTHCNAGALATVGWGPPWLLSMPRTRRASAFMSLSMKRAPSCRGRA